MIPVAKPIRKPPSVAVQSRSIPPTTTPTSTTIVSRSAKSGCTKGCCTVRSTATTAASTPERSTATPITRLARTPSSRAVEKSVDAARMWSPILVRFSSSASSPSTTTVTATATIVIFRTSTSCTVIAWFSGAIEAATSPRVLSRRSICSAIAWSTNAIAKVVTSITAGEAPRSGRKTARSIANERTTTTTRQAARLQATRQLDVKASVYAPAMITWPYAKLTRRRTPKTRPIPTAISA